MDMHDRKLSRGASLAAAVILLGGSGAAVAGDNSRWDAAGEVARDAWIDGKVEASLLFNQHLNSFLIDTDVNGGTVVLTGRVESDIDRDLAGEIAESVQGVVEVDNRLVVDQSLADEAGQPEDASDPDYAFRQRVSDATLTARIKSELLVNQNTGGLGINVTTRNARVTLSGEVGSEQEAELAERIAANTEGVADVINRLEAEQEEAE